MEKLNTVLLIGILTTLIVLAFGIHGLGSHRYTMHLAGEFRSVIYVLDTETGEIHTFHSESGKSVVGHVDLIRGNIRGQTPIYTVPQQPAQ